MVVGYLIAPICVGVKWRTICLAYVFVLFDPCEKLYTNEQLLSHSYSTV